MKAYNFSSLISFQRRHSGNHTFQLSRDDSAMDVSSTAMNVHNAANYNVANSLPSCKGSRLQLLVETQASSSLQNVTRERRFC